MTIATAEAVIVGVPLPRGMCVPPVGQSTPGALVAGIKANLSMAEASHHAVAEDIARLRDDHSYSLRKIAEEVGCGKTTVDRHLKWLELREDSPELGYGETLRALKAPKHAEPVEVAHYDVPTEDWTLAESPEERFTSHLATAMQALEAAYAEAGANPRNFSCRWAEAPRDQVGRLKELARMIERRINAQ